MLKHFTRSLATKVNSTSLNSFNSNHALYDKVRPTFDPEFVSNFFKDLDLINTETSKNKEKIKILELAAGTGKFTKEIVKNNLDKSPKYELTIVEPSDGMLTSFRSNFPDLTSKKGSSYELPFDDHSIDAIIIAQGFHWFSDLQSLKELHRVLKKDGKLGLIWNFDSIKNNRNLTQSKVDFRVEESDLKGIKAWETIAIGAHQYDGEVPQYRKANWRDVFYNQSKFALSSIKESFIYRVLPFDKDLVYDYWLSRSFITSLSDEEKLKFKNFVNEEVSKADKDQFFDDKNIKQFLGSDYFVIGVNN